MDGLKQIVREEMRWYVGNGYGANCRVFIMDDERESVTALIIADYPKREIPAEVIMMVRVVGEDVLIEEDNTDKPLYKALLNRGIPREHIILLYAGESLPAPEAVR